MWHAPPVLVRGWLIRYFIPWLCLAATVMLGAHRGAEGVVAGLAVAVPFLVLAHRAVVVADEAGVAITNITTSRVNWVEVGEVHMSRYPNGYLLLFRLHDGRDIKAFATATYFGAQARMMRDLILSVAPEGLRTQELSPP